MGKSFVYQVEISWCPANVWVIVFLRLMLIEVSSSLKAMSELSLTATSVFEAVPGEKKGDSAVVVSVTSVTAEMSVVWAFPRMKGAPMMPLLVDVVPLTADGVVSFVTSVTAGNTCNSSKRMVMMTLFIFLVLFRVVAGYCEKEVWSSMSVRGNGKRKDRG